MRHFGFVTCSWLNAMKTSRVLHINSQHWYVCPSHMGDGHCSSMQCQDALRMISFSCCPFPVGPNAPFQCLSSLGSRTILSNTNANHKYQITIKQDYDKHLNLVCLSLYTMTFNICIALCWVCRNVLEITSLYQWRKTFYKLSQPFQAICLCWTSSFCTLSGQNGLLRRQNGGHFSPHPTGLLSVEPEFWAHHGAASFRLNLRFNILRWQNT